MSYFLRENYATIHLRHLARRTRFQGISSIFNPKTKNEIADFSRNFQDLKVPSSTYQLAE